MRSYHTGVGDLVVLMCIALCLFLAFLAYNPARVRGLHARFCTRGASRDGT